MKRTWIRTAATAVAVALALTGCAAGGATGSGGSTLTVSVPFDLNSFDSADLQGGGMELYWGAVYDTLLRHPEGGGEPVANAAESFSYNADKTELTLVLRPGMTFSDGSQVTADAVAQSMTRMQEGTGASAGYLSSVESIDVLDPTTVRLNLPLADPVLLTYLTGAAGVIANPAAFDSEDFSRVPAGSGPYVLDTAASTQGVQYTFTRRADYWDAASYPYETMVALVMSDQTARINALIAGQLDFSTVDTPSLPQATQAGLTVQTIKSGWVGMMLADRDGTIVPALKDVRVRQAINYAFDREAIVEAYFSGTGLATQTIFDVGSEAFNEAADTMYDYDPARARALLAEAGYGDGFAVTMPSSPSSANLDGVVKQSLADIGIEVTYVSMSDEQRTPDLLDAEYGMFAFGDESQTAYYDIKKCLLPDAVWNPFRTTRPELAQLAEAARTATDPELARDIYQQVGLYVAEQAWFVPITKTPVSYATSTAVTFTPTPRDPQVLPRHFAPVQG